MLLEHVEGRQFLAIVAPVLRRHLLENVVDLLHLGSGQLSLISSGDAVQDPSRLILLLVAFEEKVIFRWELILSPFCALQIGSKCSK